MEGETQVLARHPAPVDFVPKGGRDWQLELVETRSPVILRHAHPDQFEPHGTSVLSWSNTQGPFLGEGALWSPIGGWDRATGGVVPLPAAEIVRFLEDDAHYNIRLAFEGTPANAKLLAYDVSRHESVDELKAHQGKVEGGSFRGARVDLDAVRSIRRDGRAGAAAALQDYLDRNLRIVGEHVYLRRHEMLACRRISSVHALWERVVNLVGAQSDTLLAVPEGYEAVRDHAGREGVELGAPPDLDIDAWLAAVPPGSSRDEDVLRVAGGSCFLVRRTLDLCLRAIDRGRGDALGMRGPIRNLRDEVREAEAWAWMGAFGRDDPQAAVELLLRATDVAAEAAEELGIPSRRTLALLERGRALRELYLPMCRAEVVPEDVESLSAAATR